MFYDENRVCVEGSVIIDSVQHYVMNKFVSCDSSLNQRSWNTTIKKSICPICKKYLNPIYKQLTMEF